MLGHIHTHTRTQPRCVQYSMSFVSCVMYLDTLFRDPNVLKNTPYSDVMVNIYREHALEMVREAHQH